MGQTYYVYEGVGIDSPSRGLTMDDPLATVAYALALMEAGDIVKLRTIRIARNKPNAGVPVYSRCYFVDAALGTDDANHGDRDGANAWATLQYALDNANTAVDVWIFCKGTETLSAAIDVDVGTVTGHWRIVEGYTTSPRDGGYYTLDGGSSVAIAIQWANVDGVLLANLKAQNFTGTVAHLGNPGSDSGMVCWNVWALPASGQKGFYSPSTANAPVLLYCRVSGGGVGFDMAWGQSICIGCYALSCTTAGFQTQFILAAIRCIAKGCAVGFNAYSARLHCFDCLAYACTASGFRCETVYGIVLGRGCIAKSCGTYGFYRLGSSATWMLLTNCDAHGNTSGEYYQYEQFDGLLSSDPLLVDAANEDFRVKVGSPCLNGGVSNLHSIITSGQFAHMGPHVHRLVTPAPGRLARAGNPGAAVSL